MTMCTFNGCCVCDLWKNKVASYYDGEWMSFILIIANLQSSHQNNRNPVNLFPSFLNLQIAHKILQVDKALVSICVFILLYTPNSELEQHDTWHTQTSIQRIGWVNTEVRRINVSLAHLWKWIHTRKSTVFNTRKGHLLHMEWMRC